jgi:RsiW-degrading membrane proteinase PrsW (M82 family)
MLILHIIIGWLFLMAAYMLRMKFLDDRATGKRFLDFGDFNFVVRSLAVLVATWLAFTIASPEPVFSSPDEQVDAGERTQQPWLVTDAMWKKIRGEPKNPDHHFRLLQAHFMQEREPYTPPDIRMFNLEGVAIFSYYSELAENSDDPELNDLGYLFLAYWYIERLGHDADNASFCLRQVKNRELKYLNYIAGRVLSYSTGPYIAEPFFISEIAANGYKEGAWEELAWIYHNTGRDAELKKLAYDAESRNAVPNALRYKVYFAEGDLLSFYSLHFSSMFGTLPLWGILGDLLILFTWLFFLRRLSFLSPVKWLHLFLAVAIGSLLAMFSWLLYQFYHDVLHFSTNGNIGNDFLYCFLGIGFIEELVKLIPFLLILRFTNIIKRPIDYLLVASAAGLGFAFFENLLYISQYGLDVIHARALTSSVSHMASSAVVAYGFVLVRFRFPARTWLIPVFFLAAALAHGFYDFWLLNDRVRSLSIVTLFFYLSEILVYVSFLNNALNQSTGELRSANQLSFNTQRLASFIAGSLVLVFMIEYIGTCIVYGTAIGNHTLQNSFLSGGYLVFFLSVRLSNIDIVPGEWSKIEFFTGLLPSDLLGSSRKRNFNSVVGLRLVLRSDPSTGGFSFQLPLSGQVLRRLTIQAYNGWFELQPDIPVQVGLLAHDRIYIRAKSDNDLISRERPVTVGVYLRIADIENPASSKLVFVDWAQAEVW